MFRPAGRSAAPHTTWLSAQGLHVIPFNLPPCPAITRETLKSDRVVVRWLRSCVPGQSTGTTFGTQRRSGPGQHRGQTDALLAFIGSLLTITGGNTAWSKAAQPAVSIFAAAACTTFARRAQRRSHTRVPPMVPRSLRAGPPFGSCASRTCLLLLPLRHVCLRSRFSLRCTPAGTRVGLAPLGRRAAQAETTPEAHMTKW